MAAEGASPRDLADALAELKARRVGERHPGGLTLGADQVLDLDGAAIGKAATPEEALDILGRLAGRTHAIHAAAVIWEDGRPVWRHIGHARLRMRRPSPAYLAGYVERNWAEIRHSAGCYQVEAEGVRLFESITGDYHAILGLPLVQLLSYLALRGVIEA
jgi:septum formation protein